VIPGVTNLGHHARHHVVEVVAVGLPIPVPFAELALIQSRCLSGIAAFCLLLPETDGGAEIDGTIVGN
jgi:hypothetical protein